MFKMFAAPYNEDSARGRFVTTADKIVIHLNQALERIDNLEKHLNNIEQEKDFLKEALEKIYEFNKELLETNRALTKK